MATGNRVPFKPVRGEEASLLAREPINGYVYFATDTGKIFLGSEGEFKVMGGSGASLFYASDAEVRQDLLTEHYFLDQSMLDDEKAVVKVNDLIINIDGCFYRVVDFDENEIECLRMAVSGSGGGGGGSDEPGSTSTVKLTAIESVPNAFIYGQKYMAKYHISASDDSTVSITVRVAGTNGQLIEKFIGLFANESDFSFDLGALLFQGTNTVYIAAVGNDTDTTATVKLAQRSSYAVSLSKVNNFNPREVYHGDFSLICLATGALEETITVKIDNGALPSVTKVKGPNDPQQQSILINTSDFANGYHTLSATLSVSAGNLTVETDPIEYEIAFAREDAEDPIIWFPNNYPENIVNYEDLNVEYMVYDPMSETNKDIETHFYKNTDELSYSPLRVSYDSLKPNSWYISDYDIGINHYSIAVRGVSRPVTVTVAEDTSRNMDIIPDSLVLNYECASRSNQENSANRATWFSSTSNKNPVVFNNFNWYNNGWMTDENNKTCLRISNGASISIPIPTSMGLLASTRLSTNVAFEFRFKLRNVQKYATLISTSSRVDDAGNLVVEKSVSSTEGVVGKFFNSLGLCLGTQEAFFKSQNEIVSVRYREDEMINLSVVIESSAGAKPLMYIYLNGILSGIAAYTAASDNFVSNANAIEFNSEYADIDLYKVRVYNGNYLLTSADVVHNYLSDIKDAVKFDSNVAIVSYKGTLPYVDFEKMVEYNEKHPDQTLMPYAVIEVLDADGRLPYIKGGKKPVAVDFVNPALDYAYHEGLIDDETYIKSAPSFRFKSSAKSIDVQGTSSQGYPIRNFKIKMKQDDAKAGEDGATWEYTDGPFKGSNILKGVTINDTKYSKWFMDSDIGESTFTWKADYMESSSTHNTGFASFINKLYERNDGTVHHPLDDYGVSHGASIRTTVYGFPMLVFQKKVTGSTVTYDFVGRYNYNLDKGCNDTYGFKLGDSKVRDPESGKFIPMEEIAECWELTNNQGKRCSFTKADFEETTTVYTPIEESNIKEADYNAGLYYVQVMEYDETVTANVEKYYPAKEGEHSAPFNPEGPYWSRSDASLDINNDFEYRYSFYEDQIDCALEGKDYKDDDGNVLIPFASQTQTERNNYLLERFNNLRKVAEWLKSTDGNVAKFRAEFNEHFSRDYCIIYYIATELLHLYDSRGKNMMLATWGPQVEGGEYIWYPIFYDIDTQLGINNSGVPTWDYDVEPSKDNQFSTSNSVLWKNLWDAFSVEIMDTYKQLRKGNLTFDVLEGYYNARPVLGTTYDSWKDIIRNGAEKNIVSYAKIGKRPENVINIDEYYKYIGPTMDGFINTSGELVHDSGSFFYCLQGTRELTRYLYLRNRLNYVDSMWHGGSYASGQSGQAVVQEFWSRFDANYPQATSDKYLQYNDGDTHKSAAKDKDGNDKAAGSLIADGDTEEFVVTIEGADGQIIQSTDRFYFYKETQPLDATGNFDGVKSYLKQYMSLVYDTTQLDTVYCNGEDPISLPITAAQQEAVKYTAGLTQQLMYIGGGEYISELGDLGLKYLDELHIPTLKRLKTLRVGSDVEGYYNSQLNSSNFVLAASATAGVNGEVNKYAKTLLEQIILTGLTSLNGQIDVSGSEKLKEFRALNTIISGVDLADGVQIETLHLPSTITSLSLTEPVALKQIVDTPKDEDGNIRSGLFIEGLTGKVRNDTDVDKTHITRYNVVGGSLGYGSYTILEKLVQLKTAMQNMQESALLGYDKNLAINLENVNWSPYVRVDSGDPYVTEDSSLYFKDNGHNQLLPYSYDSSTWTIDTANGVIYVYHEELNTRDITDLESVLGVIIDSYLEAKRQGNKQYNYFTNTSLTATGITLPEITGMIYIDNATAIPEDKIFNNYTAYFPNLKIFAANVEESYSATYVSLDGNIETVEFMERVSTDITDPHFTYPEHIIPIKINYDFEGWSLQKPSEDMSTEALRNLVISREDFANLALDASHKAYKFYAIFTITTYKNIFLNSDDSLIIETYTTAGAYIQEPNVVPIAPRAVDLEKVWKHVGWTLSKEDCYPANETAADKVMVTLQAIMAQNNDRTFYPVYLEADVHDVILDSKSLSCSAYSWPDPIDPSYNISGVMLFPKSGVAINGKITLPNTFEGQPVVGIRNFSSDVSTPTHVFWENGDNPNLRVVASSAFGGLGLQYFEFTSGLRRIEDGAFNANGAPGTMTDPKCAELFGRSPLYDLGAYALAQAMSFNLDAEHPFRIRGTIHDIGAGALMFRAEDETISITNLIIGSDTERTDLRTCGDASAMGIQPSNPVWGEHYLRNVEIYAREGFNSSVTSYIFADNITVR